MPFEMPRLRLAICSNRARAEAFNAQHERCVPSIEQFRRDYLDDAGGVVS